jgi:glycyl-tRNA synthetase beta chain
LGLVNMMIEAKWQLSLAKVVAKAMDLYNLTDEAARAKMQQDVADFMRLRLKNVLDDVRYDVVDAVLTEVDDLYAVSLRAQAVQKFVSGDAAAHIQAFVRAANLAAKVAEINEQKHLCGRVPVESEIQRMIDQAKELEPRMTY